MSKHFPITLVVAVLLSCVAPQIVRAEVADSTIEMFVKDALRDDSQVDASELTVTTKDGIVTLSGSVTSLAAKQYTVLEAKKINGVLGVIDRIAVLPTYRLDTDIANSVRRRILNSVVINSQDIKVACKDGVVTLTGAVDSYVEEQQAGLLASEVQGVKEVKNNIITNWSSTRTDQELKGDAVAALERDVYFAGLPITVSVKDGVITLSGSVGNAYEPNRAYSDVRWIPGVKSVENDLTVKWYENHGVRKQKTVPSDSDLKATVRKALDYDSRLNAADITLRVSFGHVTLDGFVYSHYEQNIAVQDTKNVVGVAWVTNNLFARVDKRADWEIAGDIDFNLDTDALTEGFNLVVTVKDGIATLSGNVHTWYERSHAYDVASRVRGVKRVINTITVSTDEWKKNVELVKTIKGRLKSNWTTWWVSNKINVTVEDGVATLEGDVNSWKQRLKADDIAQHTAGISGVDNRISVKGVEYPWDEYHF